MLYISNIVLESSNIMLEINIKGGIEVDQILWITTSIVTAIIIVVIGFIKFQRLRRAKKFDVALKTERTVSQTLTSLAISLVVLGIIFGTDRLASYSFFGAGVIISIISMIQYRRTT